MSEEDHGVAQALLAELEAGGELIDAGGFSIDAVQARIKLREFQLADPHEYVLLLIEAAVLAGADPVRVRSDRGEITVELGSLRIERAELEQLFAAAFVDLSGVDAQERSRRRALQKLAFACNAALGIEPERVEIVVPGAESALTLTLTPKNERGELQSSAVASEQPSTIVRVRRGLLASGQREAALIRERCRFSAYKIELDGEVISIGHRFALHVELDPAQPALTPNARRVRPIELDGRPIGCAGLRYADKAPAEVRVLTNGVFAERFELGDEQRKGMSNFGAIVELDLPKDLGQTRLARGPELERMLAAIWAVHDQLAPRRVGGSYRSGLPAYQALPAPIALWILGGFALAGLLIWIDSGSPTPGLTSVFGWTLLFFSVIAVLVLGYLKVK